MIARREDFAAPPRDVSLSQPDLPAGARQALEALRRDPELFPFRIEVEEDLESLTMDVVLQAFDGGSVEVQHEGTEVVIRIDGREGGRESDYRIVVALPPDTSASAVKVRYRDGILRLVMRKPRPGRVDPDAVPGVEEDRGKPTDPRTDADDGTSSQNDLAPWARAPPGPGDVSHVSPLLRARPLTGRACVRPGAEDARITGGRTRCRSS